MTTLTPERIEDFARYRRKQIAELRPWVIGDDMSRVSVSAPDMAAGSPKAGDMIARNPKNHADQWLVAAQYFADNFEPISAYGALSSRGAMREALVKMRDRDDRNGSLPAWYRAEIDAALSPDAPRQKEEE